MKQITSITSDRSQTFNVDVGNENVQFTLTWLPTQYGWSLDIVSNSLTIYGAKVVLTPNMLRQWRNIINWGVAFGSNSQIEPCSIDDFANERVFMYILDSDDIQTIENEIYGE